MICGIKGKVEYVGLGMVEVEVSGVSYALFVSARLAKGLNLGEERKFMTYMHVAEDDVSLYGFENREEVDMFRMLIGVSGVGPKSGMSIFNENGVDEIKKAVMEADVEFFKKVKGLGLKTAQKIIIELKTKIGSLKDLDLAVFSKSYDELNQDEVYLSLIQLGFDRKSVVEVMKKLPKDLKTIEERLEWCLKSV